MITYPIRVPRKRPSGPEGKLLIKASEYNQLAEKLENYLNKKIEESDQDIQTFNYGNIAVDLGIAKDIIREVLFSVDFGHNGLTVKKQS